MELITGLEPVTSSLPRKCSTAELYEPELQFQNLRWRIIPLKVDKLNLFLIKKNYQKKALRMVEGEGFEPSKHEAADLQSAGFDRSPTPPFKGVYF